MLSICIPTRNRAQYLARTLESITSQEAFHCSNSVEITVSDNDSSDDTAAVVLEFARRYPSKIIYSKNPSDIGDKNVEKCLSLGTGLFLKLNNDTLCWRPGSIGQILEILSATQAEKPLLVFTNRNPPSTNPLESRIGITEFVQSVSYFSTWIGVIGFWKTDFDSIPDFSSRIDSRIPQTHVLFRLLSTGRRTVVVNIPYFVSLNPGKKSGYNVAEVFGHNYLAILKQYLHSNQLDSDAYENEKKSLLINHIIPYFFNVYEEHNFDTDGFFRHLQDYWGDAYFYEAIDRFLVFPSNDEQKQPSVSARPTPSPQPEPEMNVGELWRRLNPHNETYLVRQVDISRIKVGRRTYGPLCVWTWDQDEERLTIGHFVSIGEGVKILLGGNHPYTGFSTFPFRVKYFGETNEAHTKGPVVIEDDVWIGADAVILSGVTLGKGCIVGAGSVVTKSVQPYSIVGGNPARFIKYRFETAVIEELMKIKFSELSDEAIIRNQDLLYQSLTKDNVAYIVSRLFS